MQYEILFIILLIIGVVATGFCFGYEAVLFSQTGEKHFNFLKYFPFELNSFKRDQKKSYLVFVIEICASLCFVVASLFFAFKFSPTHATSSYIFFAISTLSVISFNILRFIKLRNFKLHIAFTTINFFLNFLLVILYYIFFANPDYGYSIKTGVRIAEIVVLIIIVVFQCFLLMNPTYKNWSKMVKMNAEIYSRPQHCYLAIIEWGSFLSYLASFIPLIIMMFF